MALTSFGKHELLMARFGGMQIIPSQIAVVESEDWSRVRSPSRARRRLKQGHRQNIQKVYTPTAYKMGNAIYMHPALYDQLRRSQELVDK